MESVMLYALILSGLVGIPSFLGWWLGKWFHSQLEHQYALGFRHGHDQAMQDMSKRRVETFLSQMELNAAQDTLTYEAFLEELDRDGRL